MQIFQSLLDTVVELKSSSIVVLAVVIIIALLFYFLPSLIAAMRHKRNSLAIFLLNLFAGWTFLGWLISLIWAALFEKPANNQINHKQATIPHSTITSNPVIVGDNKIINDPPNVPNTSNVNKPSEGTFKNFLTKKRSIKGILKAKLW